MRKHDRSAAVDASRITDLERRIDELTSALAAERQRSEERAVLEELGAALVGELDPDRIEDAVRRWAPLAEGKPTVLAEGMARVERALAAAVSTTGRSQALHALERSLLPDALLPIPGLQLASRYLPATGSHDLGGDFYDAVRRDDRMTLIVGDVQGKGAEAATLTSLARHTLRAGAFAGRRPGALLGDLNTALLYGQAEQLHAGRDPVLRFVTAVVAGVERKGDGFSVCIARAGQPPPVIVRSAGTFEHVEPTGVLLGVADRPTFAEQTVQLEIGDTLILYTDGVIEQRDSTRSFSERHLGMLVRNRRSVVDAEATAQLIEDTVHLVSPEAVRDDVAILVACAVPTR